MKVISINAKRTVGPHEIALNLDEPITDEQVRLLEFGVLSFQGDGTVLIVKLPNDASTSSFTNESVISLNSKLADIALEFVNRERTRQRMLQGISHNTRLPLS